jgi:hypothetical protein
MEGDVRFTPPSGWHTAKLPPPLLGDGSPVTLDHWEAYGAPDGETGTAVSACFGVSLGQWADEATPIADERLDSAAIGTAVRIDPSLALHFVGESRQGAVRERVLAEHDSPEHGAMAKTFLGFEEQDGRSRLEACFVLCASRASACADAIDHLPAPEGFVPPPPPGLLLRSVVFGVHHPRGIATSAVVIFVVLSLVAIHTRPRAHRK